MNRAAWHIVSRMIGFVNFIIRSTHTYTFRRVSGSVDVIYLAKLKVLKQKFSLLQLFLTVALVACIVALFALRGTYTQRIQRLETVHQNEIVAIKISNEVESALEGKLYYRTDLPSGEWSLERRLVFSLIDVFHNASIIEQSSAMRAEHGENAHLVLARKILNSLKCRNIRDFMSLYNDEARLTANYSVVESIGASTSDLRISFAQFIEHSLSCDPQNGE